ncbi:MAG TPA: hypothetical protein DCY94_01240, partial [Firmicutes bacterium]|nr:hypothetical protein [Bacillota bacterium]
VNTYLEESLSYTLKYKTNEEGTYQSLETAHTNVPQSDRADDYNLAKNITIPAGETYNYKLTITFNNLSDINQEADRTAILNTKFNLGDSINETITSYRVLRHLKLNKKEENPNFAVTPTTDETANGLYSMEDDYGTSYYFRGAVENNYVKFVGFYWRIIRINGDGSVRMQYDGTQAWPNANGQETFTTSGTNRFTHTNIVWHTMANDAKYVGWMFGGANETASTSKAQAQINQTDSNIKKQVDAWYKTNIADKNLGRYISDEIFCNDRSTAPDGSTWDSKENSINKGFGNNFTIFGAYYRSYMENHQVPTATFICPQKNDAFTVSDTLKGNGDLSYPVGLATADEVMAAGSGRVGYDSRYNYLYKNSDYYYWLFSPCNFNTVASNHISTWSGSLNGVTTTFNRNPVANKIAAVAPVINIAPEYAKTMVG